MEITKNGIDLIKHYESLHDGDLKKIGLQPKMCPAKIWTIGYGRALTDRSGKWLKGSQDYKKLTELYPNYLTITEAQAEDMLKIDLKEFSNKVIKILNKLGVELNNDQFSAIVSICYNCGTGCLISSTGSVLTLGRVLQNKNRTKEDIEKAFGLWNKSGGKVLAGLVNRRKSESNLFNTGTLKFFN